MVDRPGILDSLKVRWNAVSTRLRRCLAQTRSRLVENDGVASEVELVAYGGAPGLIQGSGWSGPRPTTEMHCSRRNNGKDVL